MNKNIKKLGVFITALAIASVLNGSTARALNTVTAVKANSSAYRVINLTWDKVAGATGYEVYKANLKGNYVSITAPKVTSINDTGLTADRTYHYSVRAFKFVGRKKIYSGYSATASSKPYGYLEKFKDDIFVGDSITWRMGQYGYLDLKNVVAKGGATISGVKDLLVASEVKNPRRVIIMCGVNNLGYQKLDTATFKTLYKDLILTARSKYPRAQIIIEPIFRTNRACDRIRNTDVATCNAIIKSLAITNKMTFLDTSSMAVSSLDVRMPDGLHFQPSWYPTWLTFIANNI